MSAVYTKRDARVCQKRSRSDRQASGVRGAAMQSIVSDALAEAQAATAALRAAESAGRERRRLAKLAKSEATEQAKQDVTAAAAVPAAAPASDDISSVATVANVSNVSSMLSCDASDVASNLRARPFKRMKRVLVNDEKVQSKTSGLQHARSQMQLQLAHKPVPPLPPRRGGDDVRNDLSIPKKPIGRLVRELAVKDYRFQSTTVDAAQYSTESSTVDVFAGAALCAAHGKRITAKPKDLQLVQKIQARCGSTF